MYRLYAKYNVMRPQQPNYRIENRIVMENHDFSFTQDQRDARAVKGYLNPLPRSVTHGHDYELLDGIWRFQLDLEDRGMRENWYLGHHYTGQAVWPSSIEAHMAAAQDIKQEQEAHQAQHAPFWEDNVVAWYERDFTIPHAWLAASDSVVHLTFGACGYETRVWLNGHELRTVEGELDHFGEYTSFSYELPPEYLQLVNRLTVRIADSLDAEIPRGKQESRVYKRGGIWYQTISGPVRSVWIEPVRRNRLRSRLGVIACIEDHLVEFDITTRVWTPGEYNLRVVVAPRGSKQPIAVSDFELPLEAGEKRQRVTLKLSRALTWSPAEPNLYQMVAQLTDPLGATSQIETHFGLRKIEARGEDIYLNNKPIYLNGVLFQPATATFEQMSKYISAIKELGCNLVRVHIAGIDPRIYDLADEAGMLLWVEVPSPHSSSQRSRDNHWAELMRMLVIIASHPSVIICSLYNENWGIQDIAANALTREYITRVYSYMKFNYPQLLVVDNDGWQHVSSNGRLQSDLLTAHIYTTDITLWRDRLDRLVAGDIKSVTNEPLSVGDPFFYRGQLPIVVSEWGGFGFAGYGGPNEPQAKAGRIRSFKDELLQRPIAGDVYTQAVSIEQETNGLIDPQTGELSVAAGVLGSATAELHAGHHVQRSENDGMKNEMELTQRAMEDGR